MFADGSQLDMNTVQQGLLTGTDGNDSITAMPPPTPSPVARATITSAAEAVATRTCTTVATARTRSTTTTGQHSDDDRIVFGAGISQSDLGFYRDGTNLIIKIAGTNDQIRSATTLGCDQRSQQ